LAKSGSLCDGLNQTKKQQKLAIRTGKRGATISKWHLFITHMMCKKSAQGENPSQLHKRKPYRLHLPRKNVVLPSSRLSLISLRTANTTNVMETTALCHSYSNDQYFARLGWCVKMAPDICIPRCHRKPMN
jgi:hypothetical protein